MTTSARPTAGPPGPVRPGGPDPLRPPWPGDPTADAYKDWLHLNVFDYETGAVGLFNSSLHGDPISPRSVAVGCALAYLPDRGWVGSVEVVPQQLAAVGISSIATGTATVSVDGRTGMVVASARSAELAADVVTSPEASGIDLPGPTPFGAGWIGWAVIPRLRPTGRLRAGEVHIVLDGASCYHDHNWGRWYWGDDVGWDWAALLAPNPAPVFVLSRATDRAHREGSWRLTVAHAASQRSYTGRRLRVETTGRYTGSLRRWPGATAAAQTGRSRPTLPGRWLVVAGDGVDRIEIEMQASAAAQIVLADPSRRGYSYLHEIVVRFSAVGRVSGQNFTLDGLGVAERLD